ncbi:MAG: PKD domain-containing protein, partial [Patescibacteria group bacterium]
DKSDRPFTIRATNSNSNVRPLLLQLQNLQRQLLNLLKTQPVPVATPPVAPTRPVLTPSTPNQTVPTGEPQISLRYLGQFDGLPENYTFPYQIVLNRTSAETVSVTAATRDGAPTIADDLSPATAGADYVALPSTVFTFAPGETTKSFNVQFLDDNLVEGPEGFTVSLTRPVNGELVGGQSEVALTLDDPDCATLNTRPTARVGEDRVVSAGEMVTFNASQSSDTTGSISGYRFRFGDPASSDPGWQLSPLASHVYGQPGTYTATVVARDVCLTTSLEDQVQVTVNPTAASTVPAPAPIPTIASSYPPNGAVVAQDTSANWITETPLYMSSGRIPDDFPANVFSVSSTRTDSPITITNVTWIAPSGTAVFPVFSRPVLPGERVTITHRPSGSSVCLGWLPGDVNGDGRVTNLDASMMNGILAGTQTRPSYAADINRDGVINVADQTRLNELLTGTNGQERWLLRELPACPAPSLGTRPNQSQLANALSALQTLLESLARIVRGR